MDNGSEWPSPRGSWQSAGPAEPFARRLVSALLAGDRAGGDKRGRLSAGVLVVTPDGAHESGRKGRHVDVNDEHTSRRVDDHADPVFELARLVALRDVSLAVRGSGGAAVLEGPAARRSRCTAGPRRPPACRRRRRGCHRGLRTWASTEDLDERLDADDLTDDQTDLVVWTTCVTALAPGWRSAPEAAQRAGTGPRCPARAAGAAWSLRWCMRAG
jgi:uncharacterized Ntn-hydrolase superfamily protein